MDSLEPAVASMTIKKAAQKISFTYVVEPPSILVASAWALQPKIFPLRGRLFGFGPGFHLDDDPAPVNDLEPNINLKIDTAFSVFFQEIPTTGEYRFIYCQDPKLNKLYINGRETTLNCGPEGRDRLGIDLQDGDHVELYCAIDDDAKVDPVDLWFGPMTFQYRSRREYLQNVKPTPVYYGKNIFPLEKLPKKLLRKIFALLPVDYVARTMPFVCKKFNQIVAKKIKFNKFELVRAWPTLMEMRGFVDICDGFPRTVAIHGAKFHDNRELAGYLATIRNFPSTTEVFDFHFARNPKLDGALVITVLHELEHACPQTKYLTLRGITEWPVEGRISFGNLVHIGFDSQVLLFRDAPVDYLFGDFPKLNSLAFSGQVSHGFMWQGARKEYRLRLQKLEMTFDPNISLSKFKNLTVLRLRLEPRDYDACSKAIYDLKNLEYLAIYVNGSLSVEKTQCLLRSFPRKLKVLQFATLFFNNDCFKVIAKCCPGLEMLYLSHATGAVSTEGTEAVVKACKKLQWFCLRVWNFEDGEVDKSELVPERLRKNHAGWAMKLVSFFDTF